MCDSHGCPPEVFGETAGHLLAIDHLEAAAQLRRGDFLADTEAGEWAVIRREALRQPLLDALRQLGQPHFAAARCAVAARVHQRVLSFDPHLEMGYREPMRPARRNGSDGAAISRTA